MSISLEVNGERLPDVCEQRKTIEVPALSAHDDLRRPPVDVVDLESDHLPGTQAEACEEKQDCVVTASPSSRPVRHREDSFHLLR